MYSAGGSAGAVLNAAMLIGEGTSILLAVAGLAGAILLGVRAVRVRNEQAPEEVSRRATGLLLAAPALLVAVQFVALAAGKPGEYGRFAILTDAFLAVEAVVVAAPFARPARLRMLALLVVTTVVSGSLYLARFIDDASGTTTRLRAAAALVDLPPRAAIAVEAEPAPYSLPPVNLFTRQILLLPRKGQTVSTPDDRVAMLIRPVDSPTRFALPAGDEFGKAHSTPISWAAKYFAVRPLSAVGE